MCALNGSSSLWLVAYVRTVRTASGATAVQIVNSSRRGSRDIEHLGSAHDAHELAALKAAARQRIVAGRTRWTSVWPASWVGSVATMPTMCPSGSPTRHASGGHAITTPQVVYSP